MGAEDDAEVAEVAASLAAAAASLKVEARLSGRALGDAEAIERAHELYRHALARLSRGAVEITQPPQPPALEAGLAMTVLAARHPDRLLGQVLAGRYRVEHLLGRGGMGVVYAATRLDSGEAVALKLLLDVAQSDDLWQHFLHEALASQRIPHPSIVRVQDVIDVEGLRGLVLDLAPGVTLRKRLDSGRMPQPEALAIVSAAAEAVAAAHASAVLHNDLKPENLMVEGGGGAPRVRVLDFGLSVIGRLDAGGRITAAGVIMGTPLYMAPEQCRGLELDTRADVYALATILYECLAGRHPFGEPQGISELIARKAYGERPDPPSKFDPRIPAALDQLVLAGLEPDRDQRLASARELNARLAALQL